MISLIKKVKDEFAVGVLGISIAFLYFTDSLLGPLVGNAGESLPIILIGGMLLLAALATELAEGTIFPSFLVALFIGLALHGIMRPVIENAELVSTVVSVAAIYILFGGGLEIAFSRFRRVVLPVLVLSFVGLLISTFLFPALLLAIPFFKVAGVTVSIALLLGAVLASTDPAAIIPVLSRLNFKRNELKDLVISESALTDVTGALVTFSFIKFMTTKGDFSSLLNGAMAFITKDSLFFLFQEIGFGVGAGLVGFALLHFFLKRKEVKAEQPSDVALFTAIPLVAYALASIFHGSGFLAAFVAGLLVLMHEKANRTEAFFNNMTDGIAKPLIFILLGALVDIRLLLHFALPGIIAGLIFMLIVRPLAVFLSLGLLQKQTGLSVRELLFISCIRETGVIPAVLILQIGTMSTLGLGEGFLAIGMWVILMTLILLPPLTAPIARKLGIAE